MTTPRPRPQQRDCGASLILAIGFVLVIGLISGGLISLATSGLSNRSTLQILRNRQYAADGSIEQAISQVRAGAGNCTASGFVVDPSLNAIAIRVDWTTSCADIQNSDGTLVTQRNVIFSACRQTTPDVACSPANIIIRAEVNFQPSSGAVTKTYILSWSVNQ